MRWKGGLTQGFIWGEGQGHPWKDPPPPPQNFHTHTKFESMWHLGAPDAASEHLNFLGGGGGGGMPLGVVTPHAAFFPPSAKISLHLDRLQDKIWVGKACTLIYSAAMRSPISSPLASVKQKFDTTSVHCRTFSPAWPRLQALPMLFLHAGIV